MTDSIIPPVAPRRLSICLFKPKQGSSGEASPVEPLTSPKSGEASPVKPPTPDESDGVSAKDSPVKPPTAGGSGSKSKKQRERREKQQSRLEADKAIDAARKATERANEKAFELRLSAAHECTEKVGESLAMSSQQQKAHAVVPLAEKIRQKKVGFSDMRAVCLATTNITSEQREEATEQLVQLFLDNQEKLHSITCANETLIEATRNLSEKCTILTQEKKAAEGEAALDKSELMTQLANLQSELDQARTEKDSANEKLTSAKATIVEKKMTLSELQKDAAAAKNEVDSARKAESLANERTIAEKARADAEKARADAEKARADKMALEADNARATVVAGLSLQEIFDKVALVQISCDLNEKVVAAKVDLDAAKARLLIEAEEDSSYTLMGAAEQLKIAKTAFQEARNAVDFLESMPPNKRGKLCVAASNHLIQHASGPVVKPRASKQPPSEPLDVKPLASKLADATLFSSILSKSDAPSAAAVEEWPRLNPLPKTPTKLLASSDKCLLTSAFQNGHITISKVQRNTQSDKKQGENGCVWLYFSKEATDLYTFFKEITNSGPNTTRAQFHAFCNTYIWCRACAQSQKVIEEINALRLSSGLNEITRDTVFFCRGPLTDNSVLIFLNKHS